MRKEGLVIRLDYSIWAPPLVLLGSDKDNGFVSLGEAEFCYYHGLRPVGGLRPGRHRAWPALSECMAALRLIMRCQSGRQLIMPDVNPYEAIASRRAAADPPPADEVELLANTQFCVRLVAIACACLALYFVCQLLTIVSIFLSVGELYFDQGMPAVQMIRIVWSIANVMAYAGLCYLLWKYATQIAAVKAGHKLLSSTIPMQNTVWFAAAAWIMASLLVNLGFKVITTVILGLRYSWW